MLWTYAVYAIFNVAVSDSIEAFCDLLQVLFGWVKLVYLILSVIISVKKKNLN